MLGLNSKHAFPLIAFVLAIIALFFVGRAVLNFMNQIERGEDLAAVDWLPASASKISFAKCHNWQLFEFDISEDGFEAWADRWDVSEISEPFYITRYTMLESDQSFLLDGNESELGELPEEIPEYIAVVRNGLAYGKKYSNHGGIYVAYDRDEGRAYFYSSKR